MTTFSDRLVFMFSADIFFLFNYYFYLFIFTGTIATRLWQVCFHARYISSIASKALIIGSNGKTNPILK